MQPGEHATIRAAAARDRWPWLVGALNLAHALMFAHYYPQHRFDPDLLAYLVYYRNWLSGDATLHTMPYFMHPKVLLVFGLGPFASVSAALSCTLAASAVLGMLVYVISREQFGRPAALVISAALLLDPLKAFLTLGSSADLYIALFLFAAVWQCERGRYVLASTCILASALVKPVTLPCAAYFLTVESAGRRRWIAAAIPLIAIPVTLWSNWQLLGSPNATAHFFDEFTALRGGDSIGPSEVLHFALWRQLVQQRFPTTAVWGAIGLLLWVAAGRGRISSPLPLLPLLFLSGYWLLSAISPFMPFFRFFWPLEIWFLMFVVYGAIEGARRLAGGRPWLQPAVAGAVLLLLIASGIERQLDYRRNIALVFERGMEFAATAEPVLRADRRDEQTVLAPLALLPYLFWTFPDAGRDHRLETAERVALEHRLTGADWIVYTPPLFASDAARDWMPRVVEHGAYTVKARDGASALLAGAAEDGAAPLPVARR